MTGALAFEYTNKDLCVAKIDQLWEEIYRENRRHSNQPAKLIVTVNSRSFSGKIKFS